MKHQPFVIGLIGEKGAGKSTFVSIINEVLTRAFPQSTEISCVIKFSGVLKEVLDILHVEYTQSNLRLLTNILTENFGKDILGKAIKQKILTANQKIVIVDGIRQADQLRIVREFQSIIIYVTSDPERRYDRIIRRGEKVGESETTFIEFLNEENTSIENNVPIIGEQADVTINNSGSITEFTRVVEMFIKEHLMTKLA